MKALPVLLAWATCAPFVPAMADPVSPSDWSGIREARENARHAALRRDDGVLVARNPGQRWLATFDGRGFTVAPDHGGWTWGLELTGYGERTLLSAGDSEAGDRNVPAPHAEGGKITCPRDENLTEWFVNDARGLEQGWTLRHRPGGSGGPLVLTLAVRGGLRPQVSPGGAEVRFTGRGGAAALDYGGLKAWDADGKALAARFEPAGGGQLRIAVEDAAARYPVTIDPVAQQVYLKASNTGISDNFGSAVAISGNTVVVGAPRESSNATGVNGNAFNEFAPDSGAAYVFVRDGTTWTQQAYLKASNTGEGDYFGWSVAISGDTVVIGAHLEDSNTTAVNGGETDNSALAAGAAYVFTRSGTVWTQQAYLKASNAQASDLFGSAVAVSGDTVAVGANREDGSATGVNGNGADNAANLSGAAYVFFRSGSVWSQQAYLKPSDTAAGAEFGSSVGVAGNTVIVGSPLASAYTGSAYVFFRSGVLWSQQAKLTAPNAAADARFGYAVAISGDTVVAGARGEASNATGVNGNPYNSSAPNAGAAYVFARVGATWTQQAYLKATNTGADDSFGESVAIDGDLLVVGAFGEDSAATGVDGNQASNAAGSSGAAYVYSRSVGVWHPAGYLKASNTETGDWFGGAVAVAGDTVFVGAASESSAAFGVNGAQSGNGATASGAAYGYIVPPPGPPEIAVEQPAGPALLDGAGTVTYLPAATGAGMAKSFTVRNTGSGPLIITGYVFGGTNPGNFTVDTSGMPGAIHAGLQGTLRVYFTGPSVGSYSATLQMISNDADESPFDIALSASAQSAASLYNAWTSAAGLVGGAAGKEFVPFNDGVENVMKYAFNMNGGGADTRSLGATGGIAGLPVFYAAVSGAQPVFRAEYLRRKGSGVIYSPMVSATLSGTFVPMTGTTSLTDIDGQWERVRLDQPRNPATTTKGFGYLEVTLP